MRVFTTLDEVAAAVGDELGTSDWLTIDQERVDQFADATGDHQWIHVDVERGEGRAVRRHHRPRLPHPVADPLARHPGLLAGDPGRQAQLRRQQGPLPPPGAASARRSAARSRSVDVTDLPAGKQLTLKHVIEIEGEAKPACVAESVVLLLP